MTTVSLTRHTALCPAGLVVRRFPHRYNRHSFH